MSNTYCLFSLQHVQTTRNGCTFVTQFETASIHLYIQHIANLKHYSIHSFPPPPSPTLFFISCLRKRGSSCVHVPSYTFSALLCSENIWTGFPATNNNTTRQIPSIFYTKIRKIVWKIIYELNAEYMNSRNENCFCPLRFQLFILYVVFMSVWVLTYYSFYRKCNPYPNYAWAINTITLHIIHFLI